VQQKSGFKNLLLERKLNTLADSLEKKEAQLNQVLSATNMDPMALGVVTRKLEVLFLVFCTSVCPACGNAIKETLYSCVWRNMCTCVRSVICQTNQ